MDGTRPVVKCNHSLVQESEVYIPLFVSVNQFIDLFMARLPVYDLTYVDSFDTYIHIISLAAWDLKRGQLT
jgi:hypothetical protein